MLDVGCGDNSPKIIKKNRPDIHYVGLDIVEHQPVKNHHESTEEFIVTDSTNFAKKIFEQPTEFDAITSVHNLEHCDDYPAVTEAMISSLKDEGKIFISFPSEKSVTFPSRYGTLNFYDDKTHKNIIPFQKFTRLLEQRGVKIIFARQGYRPLIPFLIGLICEPFCRLTNKQAPLGGTWALYGFETVIIAEKI